MAKKDFTQINKGRMYNTIAEATQEEQEIIEAAEMKENKPKRKARKTYTEEETHAAVEALQTAGRKGMKLPRINLAFTKSNYDYICCMARVRGENLTEFVNHILNEHREAHEDVYQRAIEFKNSL